MAREDFEGVDLFGQPVPRERNRGKGRPEHEWTLENSNRINLLFATGHDEKDAAALIGISMPTLRKHYFSELAQWRVARLRLKALQLERLHVEGSKGNVAAIKELFKQMDRGAMVSGTRDMAAAPPRPKAPKLGKKQQIVVDAAEQSKDGEWGSLLH